MHSLLVLLFSLLFMGYADAHKAPHKRSSYAQLMRLVQVQKDIRVREFVTDCIMRRYVDGARAEIFTLFTEATTLHGSLDKLSHEICLAAYDDLPRFETQKDIARAVAEGTLHAVESLHIAWPEGLPVERRVLRVWAHTYLTNLARRAGAEGITLRVTSLTRPVELQKSLARRGATPAHCNEPLVCGTHATGAAFDISTRTLSVSERSWIANELMTDMKESRILFILEARGAHFHIFVPKPQP